MSDVQWFTAGMCSSSDCRVQYFPDPGSCEVEVHSSVERLFGSSIRECAQRMLEAFGVMHGRLVIDDDGALEPVLAARIETVLRMAGYGVQSASVGSLEQPLGPHAGNRFPACRDRVRWARLYLPGNQPHFMVNADSFGADMLVFDLEDSVPQDRKLEARILVRNMLGCHLLFRKSELAVRINPLNGSCGREDLEEVIRGRPHTIVLPKAESAREVQQLDEELSRLEELHGMERGAFLIMPLIESARGVLAAHDIAAASSRNAALFFGYEDFITDIHAGAGRPQATLSGAAGQQEAMLARQMIVLAARACNIDPLDSVVSNTDDLEALRLSCLESRQLGMGGRAAIHPIQIPAIRECFSHSEQEIAWAKGVMEVYEKSLAEGKGAAAQASSMIDAPVVARARRILQEVMNKD